MKAQEAIKTLKMEMLGDDEQMKYAKQMAIEALEKQIPKEPIKKYDCKNCIHDEICPVWDDYNDEPCKDGYRGFCHNYDKFKDKSLIVELPCRVGEEIYVLNKENIPQRMILDKPDIRCYCPKEDFLCKASCDDMKHCYCAYHFNYDGSDIGEKVFRTKEEAEEKLKELNNEQD